MQYRLIINVGATHPVKEILSSRQQLRSAVRYYNAIGHTIIEVQIRNDKNENWRTT